MLPLPSPIGEEAPRRRRRGRRGRGSRQRHGGWGDEAVSL